MCFSFLEVRMHAEVWPALRGEPGGKICFKCLKIKQITLWKRTNTLSFISFLILFVLFINVWNNVSLQSHFIRFVYLSQNLPSVNNFLESLASYLICIWKCVLLREITLAVTLVLAWLRYSNGTNLISSIRLWIMISNRKQLATI